MLAQLLEDKRKSTDITSSKKSKGKRKEEESSSSVHIEEKEQSTLSLLNPHLRGDHGMIHSKRISQLEQRLEALTNRKGLQEAGVIRLTQLNRIFSRTLLSSKLQPYRPSMAKGH